MVEDASADLELWAEISARSEEIVDFDPAQVEGWVSGLFTVWESDEEVVGFLGWCADNPTPAVALVSAGLALMVDEPLRATVAAAAALVAGRVGEDMPRTAAELGRAVPVEAWQVSAPFGRSFVVGYGPPRAGKADHVVMADVDEQGRLVDLQLSAAEELVVYQGQDRPESLMIEEAEVGPVLDAIAEAWRSGVEADCPAGPGVAANQRLIRMRLSQYPGAEVPLFETRVGAADIARGLGPEDFAAANRAACSTLQSALGEPDEDAIEADRTWVGVVRGDIDGTTSRERDALVWLEWADWLGAGIGLHRAGIGAAVTARALVDMVNRCPEVSTSVPAQDRDYAEWAFGVAIDFLSDAGLVVDGTLTEPAHRSLHRSLLQAWSPNLT